MSCNSIPIQKRSHPEAGESPSEVSKCSVPKDRSKPPGLGYNLADLVWTMNEICFIAIARYLIYGIAANSACVQVIENFQLVIKGQLLVQQLNKLFEAACVHNASPRYAVREPVRAKRMRV
jgi:hypothetical protein